MSTPTLILCCVLFFVLFATLRAARSARPSPLVVLVGTSLVAMGALGGWYSWAETRSLGWTVGYCGLSLLGAAMLLRQVAAFAGKASPPDNLS